MAFNSAGLSIVCHAMNQTAGAGRTGVNNMFFYAGGADTLAAILTAGFFNNDRHRLQPGDVILLSFGLGGTVGTASCVVATVPAAPANVTVTREIYV